ncbi:MAG: hypothetical protein WDZ80_05830 [Candidatus Paceibacterota bacterium]
MKKIKENHLNLILVVLLLIFTVGFWIISSNINEVNNNISNLDNKLEPLYREYNAVGPNGSGNTEDDSDDNEVQSISTAIIFEKESSPLLSPQTNLTITVENISKDEEGLVNVSFRVFTKEASSYSAFDSVNTFEAVIMGGQSQKPLKTNGPLDSMPPQSVVNGEASFKIEGNSDEFILQINSSDEIKFYLFNFEESSYEETALG